MYKGRRSCQLCASTKNNRDTFWECDICKVPLCNTPHGGTRGKICFQAWHTVEDLEREQTIRRMKLDMHRSSKKCEEGTDSLDSNKEERKEEASNEDQWGGSSVSTSALIIRTRAQQREERKLQENKDEIAKKKRKKLAEARKEHSKPKRQLRSVPGHAKNPSLRK